MHSQAVTSVQGRGNPEFHAQAVQTKTQASRRASSPPRLQSSSPQESRFSAQPGRGPVQHRIASQPRWQQSFGPAELARHRLLTAIRLDNWQEVESTRAQHPQFSFLGDALLRLAAQTGAATVALHLQSQGDDPFWPDAADSAFYDALCRGDGKLAWQMLDVAHTANGGELPDLAPYLEVALDRNDTAAATLLLTFSVKLKSIMPFEVLLAAISTNNVERVDSLIRQRGISLAFQSQAAERSVLHYAVSKGSAETLACLLDRTSGLERAAGLCDKDHRTGNTALHLAAASGELEKLWLILDFDPGVQAGTGSINAENSAGKTALALALEAGQSDMADLLQSRGARP